MYALGTYEMTQRDAHGLCVVEYTDGAKSSRTRWSRNDGSKDVVSGLYDDLCHLNYLHSVNR